MLSKISYCLSCSVELKDPGFVKFLCPKCGEPLGRCKKCRKKNNLYTCPNCGNTGP